MPIDTSNFASRPASTEEEIPMSQTRFPRLFVKFRLRDLWRIWRAGGRLTVAFSIDYRGKIDGVKWRAFNGTDEQMIEWMKTGKWPGSDRPDN